MELSQDIQPSRAWYAVAMALPLLGIAIFVFFLWTNLSHIADSLIQVVVPGETVITLSKPGNYTVFHEVDSTVGNKIYHSSGDISGLALVLKSPSGDDVPLVPSEIHQTYQLRGRKGVSAFEFSVFSPGKYRLSAQYPLGSSGGSTVLAIGQGFMKNLMLTIFGGIAIFFGGLILGSALGLVTFFKRRSAIKQLEMLGGR